MCDRATSPVFAVPRVMEIDGGGKDAGLGTAVLGRDNALSRAYAQRVDALKHGQSLAPARPSVARIAGRPQTCKEHQPTLQLIVERAALREANVEHLELEIFIS